MPDPVPLPYTTLCAQLHSERVILPAFHDLQDAHVTLHAPVWATEAQLAPDIAVVQTHFPACVVTIVRVSDVPPDALLPGWQALAPEKGATKCP